LAADGSAAGKQRDVSSSLVPSAEYHEKTQKEPIHYRLIVTVHTVFLGPNQLVDGFIDTTAIHGPPISSLRSQYSTVIKSRDVRARQRGQHNADPVEGLSNGMS